MLYDTEKPCPDNFDEIIYNEIRKYIKAGTIISNIHTKKFGPTDLPYLERGELSNMVDALCSWAQSEQGTRYWEDIYDNASDNEVEEVFSYEEWLHFIEIFGFYEAISNKEEDML